MLCIKSTQYSSKCHTSEKCACVISSHLHRYIYPCKKEFILNIVDIYSIVQEISGCNADSSYSRNCGIILGFLFINLHSDIYRYRYISNFNNLINFRYIWTWMTLQRITGFVYCSGNGHNSASLCTLGMHICFPVQVHLNSNFIKIYPKKATQYDFTPSIWSFSYSSIAINLFLYMQMDFQVTRFGT